MFDNNTPLFFLDPETEDQYILYREDETFPKLVKVNPAEESENNPGGIKGFVKNKTLFLIGGKGKFKTEDSINLNEVVVAEISTDKKGKVTDVKSDVVRYDMNFKKVKESSLKDITGKVKFLMRNEDLLRLTNDNEFDDSLIINEFFNGTITDKNVNLVNVNMLAHHPDGAEFAEIVFEYLSEWEQKTQAAQQNDERQEKPYYKENFNNKALVVCGALSDADKKIIEKYGRDLTDLAMRGKINSAIDREDEITEVVETLGRLKKNCPIILGESGVGKTAVLEELANRIVKGEAPDYINVKNLIEIDLSSVVAGTKFRGDFEKNLKEVLSLGKKPGVVLSIDETHLLVGTGSVSNSAMDAANILKPYLTDKNFRLIGATTNEEYKKYFKKDKALDRRFEPVRINPTKIEATTTILRGDWKRIKAGYGLTKKPADSLFRYIAEKADQFNAKGFEPDRSIGILDHAGSLARKMKNKTITKKHVHQAIAVISKVSVEHIQTDNDTRYLNLEATLNKKVIGQKHAVKQISDALLRKRSGISDQSRPNSFVLAGPTGVGKTLTAKKLAKALYDTEDAIIRIDMSEYMEKHSVSRLIGSPPGYKGFGETGVFEQIKENPHAVLLLDEIEKAHPDIKKILLPMLDENGKVTMGNADIISTRYLTILMTTNLGSETYSKVSIGFGDAAAAENQAVKKELSPELRGRIKACGGIIEFNALTPENILEITKLELQKVTDRFSSVQGSNFPNVKLKFSDDIINNVAKNGYSKDAGARSLDPFISKNIGLPLAKWIIPSRKKLEKMKDAATVTISSIGDDMKPKLVVNKKKAEKKRLVNKKALALT